MDLRQDQDVTAGDLYMICDHYGWKQSQIDSLVNELDPNHGDKYSFQEFMLIMQYIEHNKKSNELPVIRPSQKSLSKSPSSISHIGSVRNSILN
jgi:hypothetical protein